MPIPFAIPRYRDAPWTQGQKSDNGPSFPVFHSPYDDDEKNILNLP